MRGKSAGKIPGAATEKEPEAFKNSSGTSAGAKFVYGQIILANPKGAVFAAFQVCTGASVLG